ncbi:MAG: putative cobalt-precorrin-6Y C(15)-methyltransferase (decarboxylating) [Methanosaeta sp. PtaB.Bin039]|nr:MAG: putative cobalt-precorrin-6Y C(15)-methyltransferase (decarboxylating) [Methanosaeta sp. PtaB.Bin039]
MAGSMSDPSCRRPDLAQVYPPAEDTFLLLEAAKEEAGPDDLVLEMGCGRAIISEELAGRVRRIVATDLNPEAVLCARNKGLGTVRADLFRGLKSRFDLILFNAPYLPTAPEERVEGWINLALDGGISGRETVERFLDGLADHLTEQGRALLLISSLTGAEQVASAAAERGLKAKAIREQRVFFERLLVLRITSAGKADEDLTGLTGGSSGQI